MTIRKSMLTCAVVTLSGICLGGDISSEGRRSLDALLSSGEAALRANDPAAARDAFLDAQQLDARDFVALHGAGVAYLRLDNVPRATRMLDKAYTIAPKERAVVYNLASTLSRTDQTMRGIKLLKDYLAANSEPPDEPMLDALGISLARAAEPLRKGKLFVDAQKFYDAYTKKLEARRPGYRRWGVTWLPAEEVAAITADNAAATEEIAGCDKEIAVVDRKIAVIRKAIIPLDWKVKHGFDPQSLLDAEYAKIKALEEERAEIAERRLAAADTMQLPTMPERIGVVMLGQVAPALTPINPTTTAPAGATIKPGPVKPPAVTPPVKPTSPTQTAPPRIKPTPETPKPVAPAQPQRITRYGVAFAVTSDLLVVPAGVIESATGLTIQGAGDVSDVATLVRVDKEKNLALVKLSKKKVSPLRLGDAFNGGAVTCVSFPRVELFQPHVESISGKAPAPAPGWTVQLDQHPRLAGAPLLSDGRVIGVTFAVRDDEPSAVKALDGAALIEFLAKDVLNPGVFAMDPKDAVFQLVATHEAVLAPKPAPASEDTP